jgi:outer membrane protein TolC
VRGTLPGGGGGPNVTTHTYSAEIGASWTIDFFGRLQSLRDEALQQYFATAQAGKATHILLVSQLADQYLTMLSADELLEVTRRTLEAAQQSYELAAAQFEAGTGTELSVRQAQTIVEQARANYAAQVRNRAQYEKAIQSAFREVADGLAARGTYDDQIAALEREVAAQQTSLDLSELRFRTGVDSYLNVLTAQTNLYSAQQTLVSARLARLTNLVGLYQALGGGWIERTGDAPRPAEDLALARPLRW